MVDSDSDSDYEFAARFAGIKVERKNPTGEAASEEVTRFRPTEKQVRSALRRIEAEEKAIQNEGDAIFESVMNGRMAIEQSDYKRFDIDLDDPAVVTFGPALAQSIKHLFVSYDAAKKLLDDDSATPSAIMDAWTKVRGYTSQILPYLTAEKLTEALFPIINVALRMKFECLSVLSYYKEKTNEFRDAIQLNNILLEMCFRKYIDVRANLLRAVGILHLRQAQNFSTLARKSVAADHVRLAAEIAALLKKAGLDGFSREDNKPLLNFGDIVFSPLSWSKGNAATSTQLEQASADVGSEAESETEIEAVAPTQSSDLSDSAKAEALTTLTNAVDNAMDDDYTALNGLILKASLQDPFSVAALHMSHEDLLLNPLHVSIGASNTTVLERLLRFYPLSEYFSLIIQSRDFTNLNVIERAIEMNKTHHLDLLFRALESSLGSENGFELTSGKRVFSGQLVSDLGSLADLGVGTDVFSSADPTIQHLTYLFLHNPSQYSVTSFSDLLALAQQGQAAQANFERSQQAQQMFFRYFQNAMQAIIRKKPLLPTSPTSSPPLPRAPPLPASSSAAPPLPGVPPLPSSKAAKPKGKSKSKGKTFASVASGGLPSRDRAMELAAEALRSENTLLSTSNINEAESEAISKLEQELDLQGPGRLKDWDQFAQVDQSFGVKAEFQENLYTTSLDLSKLDKDEVKRAEEIGKQLEEIERKKEQATARVTGGDEELAHSLVMPGKAKGTPNKGDTFTDDAVKKRNNNAKRNQNKNPNKSKANEK